MMSLFCPRKQLYSAAPIAPATQICVESLLNSESYRANDELTPFLSINEEKNEQLTEMKKQMFLSAINTERDLLSIQKKL